ncbi:MAG: hypothetical protein A2821_04165 [Candidatus Magasanikbacteria bacterium RIFCSPHIGHO2_01_FULL_41_23]|uniref:NYN domain-containing protein n=1 Tax=Candidatus Magasanikbacteria bacterium RIFCSPLOWO2_01_FULL_40_15 TaxID=1798686 RepID=A0A1F6N460_9BACT|nr:MAG: hypothetical protein A2821_04165 [Candidatus Magasanikbacteria bacterium RIFCSPHIGHO2_01_FULL_41_23]OGH67126.1 MAG: hypothetical protein A3C66_02480 [Candidatus Magasanikbacteria bacterium RIFCSPHIGHO2_02_FULL_41_35]OGH76714.1 MAG: hypothetical protein A3F22_03340 [Candidatus Magasanikbacteria bacterium RIFCSPHIGHO2_12_FULL_41_16]OGH78662.1 MAG: hypothetical protein A2983_04115 [Candidatus Magasanikbacteria bacterium RIFCSPLOWO2_01_FULL_40_15]
MIQGGNNFAFIDSQNLNKTIENQGWILDYERFFVYLKEKYQVKKAFLFFGYIPKYESLYNYLRQCGYILIFKPVLPYSHTPIKGNIDAELVLHTMIVYDKFDQAVIVTGDGDFYCLVDYLQHKNKLLRLLIPDAHRYSGLLKIFSEKIDFMNRMRQALEYKKAHK